MSAPAPFGGGTFIADKSIWVRADREPVREEWQVALRNRQIATCSITVLELVSSARSGDEFQEWEQLLSPLKNVPVTASVCRAAIGAMRTLAERDDLSHRGIALPDYLIAACAQEAGIGVLHYDHHFDRLQEVLSFESRWAADPGTLDYESVTRS